ncbi:hypothetical protein, partial [Pontibacter rugosus]
FLPMPDLFKPYVTAISICMLALLMHFLREGANFNLLHLTAPVLLFVIGIVLSKLIKPVLE